MLNKLMSLSIKTKITFTIFIIILFLSIGIIYFIKTSLLNNLKESSINITKDLILANETYIIKSLLEEDYWSIYKVITSLGNLDIIKSIGLIDNTNIVIAHTNTIKYKIGQKFKLNTFNGTSILLKSGQIHHGTFIIEINDKALEYLFKDTKQQLLLYVIILAFISFVVAYFISERILKRLNILSYNAKMIQEGKINNFKKYKSKEKDELSIFQESMEIILNQLHSSIRSEQELKLFYHKILFSLNELIIITDTDLTITYHNEHIFNNIILDNNIFKDNILLIIKENQRKNINKFSIIESYQNNQFYLYVTIGQIDEHFVLSFTDITKLKNLEMKKNITNTFELIGEISSTVVHEIKNYLQPLKLLIGQDKLDINDHNKIIKIISKIDLLVSSFLNTGKPIDKDLLEFININEIIDKTIFLFKKELKSKKLNINKIYELKQLVLFGKSDFEMIVANLLKNAIEASYKYSQITIKTWEENEYLIFKITNKGKCIDCKIIDYISKPFYTTKNKGSGLGLYITYKLVYLHGGYIDVFSDEKNTSFTIYIPTHKLS